MSLALLQHTRYERTGSDLHVFGFIFEMTGVPAGGIQPNPLLTITA